MDEIQTNQRACVAAKLATLQRGDNQHTKEDRPNGLPSQSDAATLQRGGDRQSEDFKASIEASSQESAATVRNGS